MRAPRTGSGWARAVSLGRSGRLHLARGSGWARAASLGRSLRASMPFARSMLARSRHPAFARQQRRLRGTGPPLANPYSVGARVGKGYRHLASLGARPLFHRSPPARAGGTAGCWAITASASPSSRSPPESPTRCHNQTAPGGFLRSPGGRRAVGPSRLPQARAAVHHQKALPAVTTNQPLVAFQAPRGDGGPLGDPGFRKPLNSRPQARRAGRSSPTGGNSRPERTATPAPAARSDGPSRSPPPWRPSGLPGLP